MAPGQSKITWDTVCKLGLALPDAEEGIAWSSPALKVGGKMFAVIPTHRSAEPRSLAVRLPFPDRDELIAADPRTYYVKEHYIGYPCVLVRLDRIHRDALKGLLVMARNYVASTGRAKPRATAGKRRRSG